MNWLKKLIGKFSNKVDTKTETFDQWFLRQKIKNFRPYEISNYFSVFRYGVKNSPPPRAIWENILPTIRVLDKLRSETGKPIIITSSYRSFAYNKACGGAPLSQHKEFRAIDFVVPGMKPQEVYDILVGYRDQGVFSGGLGLYPTFVHIDTRGVNSSWRY